MPQKQDIFTIMGGRIKILRGKYNPTSDAVWLGAAVVPKAKTVLDVGIGTGAVSLCLLAHNPNLAITGIDISPQMLTECMFNAALNEREIELIQADILTWRTTRTFDIVITNPPYFRGTAAAHNAHHNADIYKLTKQCVKRVKPRGWFCTIVDAAVADKVIAALHDLSAGDIEIIPLFGKIPSPQSPVPSERVIIRARMGVRGGVRLYSGVSMNDDRILRDGLTIDTLFTNI